MVVRFLARGSNLRWPPHRSVLSPRPLPWAATGGRGAHGLRGAVAQGVSEVVVRVGVGREDGQGGAAARLCLLIAPTAPVREPAAEVCLHARRALGVERDGLFVATERVINVAPGRQARRRGC